MAGNERIGIFTSKEWEIDKLNEDKKVVCSLKMIPCSIVTNRRALCYETDY